MLIYDKQTILFITYQENCTTSHYPESFNIHAPSGHKESLNPLITIPNKPTDEQSKYFHLPRTNNYIIPVDDSILPDPLIHVKEH